MTEKTLNEAEGPTEQGRKIAPAQRKANRDGVYKRRGIWHFEYKDPQTGQWKSKTSSTSNYNDAKAFKKSFTDLLNSGQYEPSNDRKLFSHSATEYMAHRKVGASTGTLQLETERLRALSRLLAKLAGPDLKIGRIDLQLVRLYQQSRIEEGVSPRTTNMETTLLRSILRYHDQWKLDGENKYKKLKEADSQIGRALTPEEEVRMLDAAKSDPHRFVAYHATVLLNESGLRGVELRTLQLKSIDLKAMEISLKKSKTKGGVRTVALSQDALTSLEALLVRAQSLGGHLPDHYLIPARISVKAVENGKERTARTFDPTQPTKGWRTAWRNLTMDAGLKGLRGHDLRHTWITNHAEIGTPQAVLEAQAGHLSKQMTTHYTHVSQRSARKAAEELARVRNEQRAAARISIASRTEAQLSESVH